jgi:hypothetical protein
MAHPARINAAREGHWNGSADGSSPRPPPLHVDFVIGVVGGVPPAMVEDVGHLLATVERARALLGVHSPIRG